MPAKDLPYKLTSAFPVSKRIEVPAALIREAVATYESGQYLNAWRLVEGLGPMQTWSGTEAQVFGFRLAGNMGASRLAALLITRAHRAAPRDPRVAVHYGYYLQRRRGLLPCWCHASEAEVFAKESPDMLADLKAMRASIAATYRDFETAWQLWNEAVAIDPGSPWLEVEKASILLTQELRQEALESIDASLAVRPWYRPAVQYRGRILHLLGRWQEAISFLTEANAKLQSHGVAAQLMTLKREVDDHAGMAELADQIEFLSVIAEPAEREWLQARRVDLLYLKGDYATAASIAEPMNGDYYPALAKRLRQPGVQARRKRLAFEFVHQKHNTCAPATLAAVAHFWERPVTMEQIVDSICYDGTYDYSERSWAEANGFTAREFTVTLESARLLIDASVPFVVNTVEVGSAHSQALIGYDEVRQSLFIQDPGEPHYREVPAVEFLENYKLTGPRGLVLVPEEKAAWLASLPLPDTGMYDLNYRFSSALAAYDRDGAETALREMEALDSGHRLVLMGRLSLAAFDGNEVARADCLERLMEVFPDDPRLLNWKILTLRALGHSEERMRLLRATADHEAPPSWCLRMLGEELLEDARRWPEARRILLRAHSMTGSDPGVLIRLADLMRRSREGSAEDFLHAYRFAAAISDKVEGFAQLWFSHAVSHGRTEEALGWLRRRMKEYGHKSGAPALTLVQSLDLLGRPEMVEVIREAVALRPEDGDLLVELARMETRLGRYDEAAAFLQKAEGKTTPSSWQRALALLLRRRDGPAAELTIWQDILEREPLALDAHAAVARELAGTLGTPEALAHLEAVTVRFPHHYGLGQLLIEWLREVDAGLAWHQVQRMIELHPVDPWARREAALVLRELGRHEEALREARLAVEMAPDQAASHTVVGVALIALARHSEAIISLREAIRLDVNYPFSFETLMQASEGSDKQRAGLAFIRSEMIRQVLNGNGLHSYRAQAFTVLDPDELHAELTEVWKARPDLWEAWSVLIAQKLDSGEQAEAVNLAREATDRFPLLPGAWRDLATAQRLAGDLPAAVETMRYATQLNPDWPDGWLSLAEHQEDMGDAVAAVETLRRGTARLPLNQNLRGTLATLLWRCDSRAEAWSLAEKTVTEDPAQDWAWNALNNWAAPLQKQEALLTLGRSLTEQRPQEARSWFILARLLPLEKFTEMLAALNRAIEINPLLIDAYDHRVQMLAQLGRLDEAEASLKTGPWENEAMPSTLCGRSAWLQALRGDPIGAIRRMKVVLERHRNYYWGWEMISVWAEQRVDLTHWRAAAKEMIRLNPRGGAPYCTAADAELRGGKPDQGKRYLRQALHVEPGNAYAAHRLLSLYWDNRDIPAVVETANGLITHGMVGLIRRVFLMLAAAQREQFDQVRTDLNWLATQPDMLGPMLELIQNYFQNHKRQLRSILDEVLETTSKADRIGPAFAMLWVQVQAQKRVWMCWRQLASWHSRLGRQIMPAVGLYLDFIGEARAADPHVSEFTAQCGDWLREHADIWGKVSFALANSGRWHACVDWVLPDYRRPDAEGWVLSNLVQSLREIDRSDKAGEVSQHVITQGLRDATWPMHVAIAAHDSALAGRYSDVQQLLSREPFKDTASEWQILALTASGLASVMPHPRPVAKRAFLAFLAASKNRLAGTALSASVQRDVDAAVDKMKNHTGVWIMPWQKLKPRAGRAESTGGGGSTWWIIPLAILVFNLLRACASQFTSANSHVPSVHEVNEQARSVLERYEALHPTPTLITPSPRLDDFAPKYLEVPPDLRQPLLQRQN
jgi:tetratricopeptide (TPR) repeat protein